MPKVKQISTKLQEYLELLFKELDKNLVNELEPKIMLDNSEEIQKKYQAEMPNDSEMPKVFSRDRKILICSDIEDSDHSCIVLEINKKEEFTEGIEKNLPTLIGVLINRFLRIAKKFFSAYEDKNTSISLKWDYPPQETLRAVARNCIYWNNLGKPNNWRLEIDDFNNISILSHEKEACFGRLIIADKPKKHESIEILVEFKESVEISDYRKTRKILNLSTEDNFLILDASALDQKIVGIGKFKKSDFTTLSSDSQKNLFFVDFKGRFYWEFGYFVEPINRNSGVKIIMVVKDGKPLLPKDIIEQEQEFKNYCRQIFTGINQSKIDSLYRLYSGAIQQKHGTMLVILNEQGAKAEAERLGNQCFKIVPKKLDPELIEKLTSIDGSMLLSSDGTCHAIGVILDGIVDKEKGNSARGARYNSAVRYHKYITESYKHYQLLIVVISEDGMIDFIANDTL